MCRTIREKDVLPVFAALRMGRGGFSATAARLGADPSRLAGALRGDLDWIAMKAMEKDRTRRCRNRERPALSMCNIT